MARPGQALLCHEGVGLDYSSDSRTACLCVSCRYYNKLTHESTLQRPAGFQSDEDGDIPDAPNEYTAQAKQAPERTKQATGTTVVLKYAFQAALDDEQQLSASKNEEVTLVQEFDDGWWKVRNSSNEEGFASGVV